jgi:tetratricopeptide (TPR) repeat protein
MSVMKSLPPTFRKRVAVAFALFLCGALLAPASPGQTAGTNAAQAGGDGAAPQRLAPGQTVERELKGGEAHTYLISLRQGEFLRVLVEQKTVNLVVRLRSGAGAKLAEVDFTEEGGQEPVSYEAAAGGEYILEVSPTDAKARAGRYGFNSSVRPRATEEDRARMAAERLRMEGEELYVAGGAANMRRALAKARQSLVLWRGLDDKYWAGHTLNAVGVMYEKLGERQKALDSYEEALSVRRGIGDRRGEGNTLSNLGNYYYTAGQKQQALEFFKQATAVYRAAGDRRPETSLVNQLGITYSDLGEIQKALDAYNEAVRLARELGEPLMEADVLNNIGYAYYKQKEREKALGYYEQALRLYEANGGRDGRATTLRNLGIAYVEAGDLKNALEYYERLLAYSREVRDPEIGAEAFWHLGNVEHRLGDKQKALDHYNRGLTLTQQTKSRAWQRSFLSSLGNLYGDLGDWQNAVKYYERALSLHRENGDARGEMDTLYSIGAILYERDKRRAVGYYLRLARLRREAKDYKGEAEALRTVGFLYDDLRQWGDARAYLAKTLAVYKANADRGGEADTLTNIGNVYYHEDRMAEALRHYEQALTIYEMQKPGLGQATALNNIGLVADNMGDSKKALDYYGRSLPLSREFGDKRGEANTLADMGLIYANLGDQQKALDYYGQALELRRSLGEKQGEADTLTNIGFSHRALGENLKAVEAFEQALKLRREIGDKHGEANALKKVGETYYALGEHQKALEHYLQSLPLLRELKDREGEMEALAYAGLLTLALGEYQQGVTHFRQAQAIAHADGDRVAEAFLLTFIGVAHFELNQEETGFAEVAQAQRVFDAEGFTPGRVWTLFLTGSMYEDSKEFDKALSYYNQSLAHMKGLGVPRLEGGLLQNIGEVYAATGKRAEALDVYSRALELYRADKYTYGEASVLVAIGDVYEGQGEKEKAAVYYARAVSLKLAKPEASGGSAPLGSRAGTYDSLGERKEQPTQPDLGRERQAQLEHYFDNFQRAQAGGLVGPAADALSRAMGTIKGQLPELAIILGKQAIAKYQEAMANPGLYEASLGEDTYMRSFASACRDLADLLIERGRLYEAQQVLAMLKEDEYVRDLRRDGDEAVALSRRADLRPEERKLFAEYARNFDKITAIGSRVATLNAREEAGEMLTESEVAERVRLYKDLSVANEAFDAFLGHIKAEFEQSGRDILKEMRVNRGLQNDLKEWGQGTVTLHTFEGPNRYRVILTTPNNQVDGKTEIKAAELNKKIMAFRQTLMNPAADPRPQARELYDILVKPVEKHLEDANARTLVWELDGALRYLPLPALYDGRQYMVERYRQVIMTGASLPRLSAEFRGEWRGLGLGVSEKWGEFAALPAVVGELGSIIHDERPPCAPGAGKDSVTGVLPGLCLVDKDFTAQSFADALRRKFSLVHIASHFSFSPGGADKSFLLLGDGTRLTLKTLNAGAEYDLGGVELLTLSACNTGVDESSEGREVENFGLIAQGRGAKAVIATLWEVADDSTRALMREFYRIHSTTPGIDKAEALRRAQLSLLNGGAAAAEGSPPRAEWAGLGAAKVNAPPFRKSPERPYAHPYYWAPFILIGNWR